MVLLPSSLLLPLSSRENLCSCCRFCPRPLPVDDPPVTLYICAGLTADTPSAPASRVRRFKFKLAAARSDEDDGDDRAFGANSCHAMWRCWRCPDAAVRRSAGSDDWSRQKDESAAAAPARERQNSGRGTQQQQRKRFSMEQQFARALNSSRRGLQGDTEKHD